MGAEYWTPERMASLLERAPTMDRGLLALEFSSLASHARAKFLETADHLAKLESCPIADPRATAEIRAQHEANARELEQLRVLDESN
jgi:hypothetical protein